MLRTLLVVASIGAAAPVLCPAVARAEPSAADKETARSLLDEGDRKYASKDYKGALDAYQGAHAIMGVPTTGIEVAKAQEALGLLVEARDTLLSITRLSVQAREPSAFSKARDDAKARAPGIAARIPSVRFSTTGPQPGAELVISVDGQALPSAAATLPRKVNPGHHRVTVSSPGFAEQTREVDIEEGKETALSFILVPGPGGGGATPAAAPAPAAEGPPPGASAGDSGATEKSSLAYVGLGVGALGVAGVVVGTIFGLNASSKWSDAKALCNPYPTNCGTDGKSLGEDAQSAATISTVGFVVGAVGIATGAVLWFAAPEKKKESGVALGVGPTSVMVKGAF
jgi:hypothetical protein